MQPVAGRWWKISKADTNDFQYKMRAGKFPAHVAQGWAELCNLKGAAGINKKKADYMTMVVTCTDPEFDTPYFKQRRIVAKETDDIDEKEWMSWTEFESKEGYDSGLLQVEHKTVQSRPHPRLPGCHGLKYPHYLQVRRPREIERSNNRTVDQVTRSATTSTDISEAFAGAFRAVSSFASSSSGISHADVVGAPVPVADGTLQVKPEMTQKQKDELLKCVGSVRTAHRAIDTAKVEADLCSRKSAGNPFLSEALATASATQVAELCDLDKELVEIDRLYRTDGSIDMANGKALSEKVKDSIMQLKQTTRKINTVIS